MNMNENDMDKTYWTKLFNAKFKIFINRMINNNNNNIDLVANLKIVLTTITTLSNRIAIHIFNDYIISDIMLNKNIVKNPTDNHILYFSKWGYSKYINKTGRSSDRGIFDMIKKVYISSSHDKQRSIIIELYWLKQIVISFTKSSEIIL
jgi:hypothetical protein